MKQAHRVVYDKFNATSMALLGKYGGKVPLFVTANLVTSARLGLVLPTTLLLSHGYTWAPASLVMINAVFDYVDGAVARWERNDSARAERISNAQPARPFGLQVSNKSQALAANWGAYYGACDFPLLSPPR